LTVESIPWRFPVLRFYLACALLVLCSPSRALPDSVASVTGRVVAEGGEPVEGADVCLEAMDGPPPPGRQYAVRQDTVKTDKGGKFEIHVAAGRYAIHAFKVEDGYPDSAFAFSLAPNREVPKVHLSPGQNLSFGDVKLGPKPAVLHLTAVDAATGGTLEEAEYTLCQVLRPTYCITSSASGVYDVSAPPTEITIDVSANGYVKTRYQEKGNSFVSPGPGEQRSIAVKLARQ
jgi:hypothetical protein